MATWADEVEDQRRDLEIDRQRERQRREMGAAMAACLTHSASDILVEHPRPWQWTVTYYDGVGIQFMDANGKPVLSSLVYDADLAADLFATFQKL